MLVRIADAAEAALAAEADVDVVELAFAGSQRQAAGSIEAVRRAFPGTLRLSVEDPHRLGDDAEAACEADEIAFPLDGPEPLDLGPAAAARATRTVGVLSPQAAQAEMLRRARGRVSAVMLDTGASGRLIDKAPIAQLDTFATTCRSNDLPFGLAGGLEPPDVARLLLLEPDVLGFDAAVRNGHRTDGALDRGAIDAIRALIPRHGAGRVEGAARPIEVIDRVFVRDFVINLAIGAYQAEHGAQQRVRFSVAADVKRAPVPPRDMRDVFSYDVILETIRVLSERPHVTFVETLADEVAASLLTHADVEAVTIKVEKLDVIDGAVGIEISRRKT